MYVPGDYYLHCMRTGQKIRRSEAVRDAYGYIVKRGHEDPKHPQENVPPPRVLKPPTFVSPEPQDSFIFAPFGADFDGTNDYMLRGGGLTDAADAATGSFSCWFRLDGGDGTAMRIFRSTSGTVNISRNSSNKISLSVTNAAGTSTLSCVSSTSFTTSATWRHIAASWNTNAASSSKTLNLYVDGTDEKTSTSDTAAAFTVDYTTAEWAVGSATDATEKWNGALAELWFLTSSTVDFTTSAQRLKFRTAAGKAVSLGADGSTPTGSRALVYLRGTSTVATDFLENWGTGGDFVIHGGGITVVQGPNGYEQITTSNF